MVAAAAALATGILLARCFVLPGPTWCFLAVAAVAFAGLVLHRSTGKGSLGLVSVLVAWVLLGGAGYTFQSRTAPANDVSGLLEDRPRLVRLRGRLVERPSVRLVPTIEEPEDREPRYRTTVTLGVSALLSPRDGTWLPVGGKVTLSVRDTLSGLLPGDEVEAVGWLSAPPRAGNPGQFDLAERRERHGVRAQLSTVSAGNVTVLRRAPWPFRSRILRARRRLAGDILSRFGRSGPLLLSLLLGERGYLGVRTREQLVQSGTMHFLSISGLHVGIVAAAAWWVLRLLSVSRRRSAVVVLAVVLVYVLLTGVRPGAVRAAVMGAVFCGGVFFLRPTDVTNSLAVAALPILLVSPAQLFEPGFQLSFVAVMGIFTFFQPVRQGLLTVFLPDAGLLKLTPGGRVRLFCIRLLAGLVAVSASAWLAVAPILAFYFHLVTPYAVPLSVIVFPVVAGLVLLGFLYLLVSLVSSPIAVPLAYVVGGLASLQRWVLELAVRLPVAKVYVAAPSFLFFVCYYGFLVAVRWGWLGPRLESTDRPGALVRRPSSAGAFSGYRMLLVGLVLACVFVLRPVLARRSGRLSLSVLDVGHGLAALVQLPNGTTLLYDAGGGSPSYDVGANIIAPALWELGVPRIDALVLSHSHWDHVSGVPALLERFAVGGCFVTRFFGDEPLGVQTLSALDGHHVPVDEVAAGDRITIDEDVLIQVLNPPRGPVGDLLSTNEASTALLIEYRGQRVLLLADVTGAWLGRVLEQLTPPVEVVQVPHHGLPDVDLKTLVDRTRPRWALISAASGERQRSARAWLEEAGVTTLTTYERGTITVVLGGSGTSVFSYRGEPTPEPMVPEEPVPLAQVRQAARLYNPRSSEMDCMDSRPIRRNSSSSRPSSVQVCMISREAPRAKLFSPKRFFMNCRSTADSFLSGWMRAQATMKPVSGSQQ